MSNADAESKQATQAPSPPHDGWLTRAQVAAELGYQSIFPIRRMEGTKLHPVREGVPNLLPYDLAFNAIALVLLLLGWWLWRSLRTFTNKEERYE